VKFDFSGAELFFAYHHGLATTQQVLDHVAYQTVRKHAQRLSEDITVAEVEKALRGQASSFYGLDDLTDHLPQIQTLLQVVQANQNAWLDLIQAALLRLLPEEDLSQMTIYPIIGYDKGIGLDDGVCLNLNWPSYWADPNEFLYAIIHQSVHIIYERHHRLAPRREVVTAEQWWSYLNLWVQNEGYAVYAPLQLRQERGDLTDPDYQILLDADALETYRIAFLDAVEVLQQTSSLSRADYLELVFGPLRLTQRVGCELVRLIEAVYGLEAVTEAFYLDGDTFMTDYGYLIED